MMFIAPYPILTGGPTVFFAALLIAALTSYNYNSIDPNQMNINIPTEGILPEYDFIVVGAGSAGSTVASRLSEVTGWTVLLLEAGGDETPLSEVPYLTRNLELTDIDWQFKTEPADNVCLAMSGARCGWPRGKLLGGTSSFGGTLYTRGNRRDYDLWESLGNPGWGYKDVLYYFKKSEDIRIPDLINSPYHSTGGPLTVSPAFYGTVLGAAWLQASGELGYPILEDYNGEFQTGFAKFQFTTCDGQRKSAARAFLRPYRNRPNLNIAMNAYVTKVLIDPNLKIAYGVEFVRDETHYIVRTRKEVIVCAGAVQSPQVLMLSGVGPAEDLAQLSIPVIQNLRVGCNLIDQVGLNGVNFLIDQPILTSDQRLIVENAVNDYAMSGSGILTFANFEDIANVNTQYNPFKDWPDIQLSMYPCVFSDTPATSAMDLSLNGSDCGRLPAKDCWGVYVSLNRAKSRGQIKLRSNNPYEYPIFLPNYLTEEVDLLTLVEGAKIAVQTSQTQAMQQFGVTFNFDFPNCTDFTLGSDDYWKCAIRYATRSAYHQVGTCKMGPCTDPEAVVDPELRVYGIQGLRVVDCSIMPTVPSGNTYAPAVMVAEKGADLIKKSWLGSCPRSKLF